MKDYGITALSALLLFSGASIAQTAEDASAACIEAARLIDEKDFVNIKSRQDLMNNKIEDKVYPLTNRLFKINPNLSLRLKEFDVVSSEVYNPINFETLTKNQEYINNLLQLNKTFKTRLSYLKLTKERMCKVLKIIDKELD